MSATDWGAGIIVTTLLCAAVVRRIRTAVGLRRERDRRELRRSAEAAYRGPHEITRAR